jgi:hypothetical protein
VSTVDVSVEIDIAAEPSDVASVMFDPAREPEWIDAVKTVTAIDPGIKPGARVERTGRLMGREIAWTTEVVSFHFPHALTLRIVDGPFVGTLQYEIGRGGAGSVARVRTVGELGKYGFLPKAMIEGPLRSTLSADLARLKALVEAK